MSIVTGRFIMSIDEVSAYSQSPEKKPISDRIRRSRYPQSPWILSGMDSLLFP
jgi:hypothetical protein